MSRTAKAFVLIFVVAAAVRLPLMFVFHHYVIGRPEPIRIALSLANHGTFANPYALPTGPTAHTAPLYPALIAPLYAIWGDTAKADYARFTLNTLAAAAEYAILPLVAIALGLGFWPGVLAGMGGALVPLHHWVECLGNFENTWTALFLELVVILFARWLRSPRLDARRAAGWGVTWGIGFLLAPNVFPVLVAFCGIAAWKLRPRPLAAARWLAIFTIVTLAVMSPWLIRNYRQLGGIVFVRDDFGLELRVSNHDGVSPVSAENFLTAYFLETHPYQGQESAREIQRHGELAFERKSLDLALRWIRNNPRAFLKLSMLRVWTFWVARVPRFRWVLASAAIGALISLVLLYRHSRNAALILASVLAGYSAIYAVVQNTLRYEHPLWWIQVLLIAWAVHSLFARYLRRPLALDMLPSVSEVGKSV